MKLAAVAFFVCVSGYSSGSAEISPATHRRYLRTLFRTWKDETEENPQAEQNAEETVPEGRFWKPQPNEPLDQEQVPSDTGDIPQGQFWKPDDSARHKSTDPDEAVATQQQPDLSKKQVDWSASEHTVTVSFPQEDATSKASSWSKFDLNATNQRAPRSASAPGSDYSQEHTDEALTQSIRGTSHARISHINRFTAVALLVVLPCLLLA